MPTRTNDARVREADRVESLYELVADANVGSFLHKPHVVRAWPDPAKVNLVLVTTQSSH